MKSRYIINWELSLACNLDCSFCSQKERRYNNSKIPSIENVYKIIDNLPENSHVSFLGGETFLYPNVIKVFERLEKNGITYEVTTNGILLDRFLKYIAILDKLTQINISIDGYGDFHDLSRGKKGLFKSLIKIIPKLNKIKNISISTVISPKLENFNLIKLHLWLDSIGIKEHKLIYMMNFSVDDVNNSKKRINDLKIGMPGSEKLDNEMLKNDFLKKLTLLKNLDKKIQIKIEPFALFQDKKLSCKQLDKQLRIDESGKLSICEFITNNFDDITKVTLKEAINNGEYVKLKEIINKNFPLDICKTCCKLYN